MNECYYEWFWLILWTEGDNEDFNMEALGSGGELVKNGNDDWDEEKPIKGNKNQVTNDEMEKGKNVLPPTGPSAYPEFVRTKTNRNTTDLGRKT